MNDKMHDDLGPEIPARQILQTVIPALTLIFVGAVICAIDFTFKFNGVGCDVFNDVIGTILIAIGVFRLAPLRVHERFELAMLFVRVAAILAIFNAFLGNFSLSGWAFSLGRSTMNLIALAGIIVFCFAMHWLSLAAGLREAARSWLWTTLLFGVFTIIPVGLAALSVFVALIFGTTFHFNSTTLIPGFIAGSFCCMMLVIWAVSLIPVVQFYLSVTRMRQEAEARAASEGRRLGASAPDAD